MLKIIQQTELATDRKYFAMSQSLKMSFTCSLKVLHNFISTINLHFATHFSKEIAPKSLLKKKINFFKKQKCLKQKPQSEKKLQS